MLSIEAFNLYIRKSSAGKSANGLGDGGTLRRTFGGWRPVRLVSRQRWHTDRGCLHSGPSFARIGHRRERIERPSEQMSDPHERISHLREWISDLFEQMLDPQEWMFDRFERIADRFERMFDLFEEIFDSHPCSSAQLFV